uniref:Uncharacterized protein n=1 Tax=Steinernema glaseri TaxID=37863 RepID=A0A1I7YHY5_9BILA
MVTVTVINLIHPYNIGPSLVNAYGMRRRRQRARMGPFRGTSPDAKVGQVGVRRSLRVLKVLKRKDSLGQLGPELARTIERRSCEHRIFTRPDLRFKFQGPKTSSLALEGEVTMQLRSHAVDEPQMMDSSNASPVHKQRDNRLREGWNARPKAAAKSGVLRRGVAYWANKRVESRAMGSDWKKADVSGPGEGLVEDKCTDDNEVMHLSAKRVRSLFVDRKKTKAGPKKKDATKKDDHICKARPSKLPKVQSDAVNNGLSQ